MEKIITLPNGQEFSKKSVKNSSPFQYKKRKNGVVFYVNDHPTVFLVANSFNEFFFVSCTFCNISQKIRFMFALSSKDEETFGFNKLNCSEESAYAKQIWNDITK